MKHESTYVISVLSYIQTMDKNFESFPIHKNRTLVITKRYSFIWYFKVQRVRVIHY
jgi:hypothetical protein